MKKMVVVGAVGALLLGVLLVVPSAQGKGGGAKGTEVWWYEGNETLIKAVFQTTGSGIVHQWRYEPENLKLIFKPVDRFPKPQGGEYRLWTYDPSQYTIDGTSPAALGDFYKEGAQYWLQITVPD